mmetsp:Transcript_127397/g.220886  ORF Transcript_127397/g.220886 Transcript_127397/m.220886 type:complete len:206 (+) Transcript_127397:187-804(+)
MAHPIYHMHLCIWQLASVEFRAIWIHLIIFRAADDLHRALDVLELVRYWARFDVKVHQEAWGDQAFAKAAARVVAAAAVHAAPRARRSIDICDWFSVFDWLVHLFALRVTIRVTGIATIELNRRDSIWMLASDAQSYDTSTAAASNGKLWCFDVVHDRQHVNALVVISHVLVRLIQSRPIVTWTCDSYYFERGRIDSINLCILAR